MTSESDKGFEDVNNNSAEKTSESAVKEAEQGKSDLVDKQKDYMDYLKAGGKSGITGDFGKPSFNWDDPDPGFAPKGSHEPNWDPDPGFAPKGSHEPNWDPDPGFAPGGKYEPLDPSNWPELPKDPGFGPYEPIDPSNLPDLPDIPNDPGFTPEPLDPSKWPELPNDPGFNPNPGNWDKPWIKPIDPLPDPIDLDPILNPDKEPKDPSWLYNKLDDRE